jgi:DNA polymerase I-like protein with 3'-5' exonuclease and polymerase domains
MQYIGRRKKMLKKNSPGRKNERRIKALKRLQKPKKAVTEDTNKKRVSQEIQTLESRILAPMEARGIRTKKDRSSNV